MCGLEPLDEKKADIDGTETNSNDRRKASENTRGIAPRCGPTEVQLQRESSKVNPAYLRLMLTGVLGQAPERAYGSPQGSQSPQQPAGW